MSTRTTRNKLRWQARKMLDDADSILQHAHLMEKIANGQSDYITVNLPAIVICVTELETVLTKFREGL